MSYFAKGIGVKCNLMNDTIDGVQKVVTQKCYLNFYVTRDSKNIKNISVGGYYAHLKKFIDISPSISAVSFETGISLSKTYAYEFLTPNPFVRINM